MAKETISIMCFSDEVNQVIKEYEHFGWEIVSNNISTRLAAADGVNIAAQNELTFNREKSVKWYSDVVALEKRYNDCKIQARNLMDSEPEKSVNFNKWIFWLTFLFTYGTLTLVYLVYYFFKKNKVKTNYEKWEKVAIPKINELKNEMNNAIANSEMLIEQE